MGVNLRETEAPGPADLADRVARNFVVAGHLQNATGFNLEKLRNHLFVYKGLEGGYYGLGEGTL